MSYLISPDPHFPDSHFPDPSTPGAHPPAPRGAARCPYPGIGQDSEFGQSVAGSPPRCPYPAFARPGAPAEMPFAESAAATASFEDALGAFIATRQSAAFAAIEQALSAVG